MNKSEVNAKDEIFTRIRKDIYVVNSASSLKYDFSIVLPRTLYTALHIYGIDLDKTILENSKKKFCQSSCWLKLKILLAHIYLILTIVEQFMSFNHITFLISGVLDSACYLGGLYIFLRRKEDIIDIFMELLLISYNADKKLKRPKREKTTLLLGAAVFLTTIYLTYGLTTYISNVMSAFKNNEGLIAEIIKFLAFVFYCFVICIGILIHLALFTQFASLISDRLLYVEEILEINIKNGTMSLKICELRQIFSKLQKLTSMCDSVFKEIIFLWLFKIIVRGCLSAVDILSRSWSGSESYTQIIVIFDVIFDLCHLLILCIYAGKIDIAKMKLQQTLIYGGSMEFVDSDMRKELHLFISMVGHSRLEFTAADVFAVNKNTALTILGALGSYCVLIYQFTQKK